MRVVADFDPSTPSIARVYDYINGGKDNFAADRELAQRLIDIFPPITVTATENKRFLDLAVGWAAGRRGRGSGSSSTSAAGCPRRQERMSRRAPSRRTRGWRTWTSTRSC